MEEYRIPLGGEIEIEELPIKGSPCLFKYFRTKTPFNNYTYSCSHSTLEGRVRDNLKDGKLIRKDAITIEDDNEKTHELQIASANKEEMILQYLGIKE